MWCVKIILNFSSLADVNQMSAICQLLGWSMQNLGYFSNFILIEKIIEQLYKGGGKSPFIQQISAKGLLHTEYCSKCSHGTRQMKSLPSGSSQSCGGRETKLKTPTKCQMVRQALTWSGAWQGQGMDWERRAFVWGLIGNLSWAELLNMKHWIKWPPRKVNGGIKM